MNEKPINITKEMKLTEFHPDFLRVKEIYCFKSTDFKK